LTNKAEFITDAYIKIKPTILYIVTTCILVEIYLRFRGTYCFLYPESGTVCSSETVTNFYLAPHHNP